MHGDPFTNSFRGAGRRNNAVSARLVRNIVIRVIGKNRDDVPRTGASSGPADTLRYARNIEYDDSIGTTGFLICDLPFSPETIPQ